MSTINRFSKLPGPPRRLLAMVCCSYLPFAIADQKVVDQSQSSNIEEVVVTADFRQVAAQKLAASVSIISEQRIRENSAQHLDDIINTVPNLNSAGGTSRARFFQIRGIGERSQFSEPLNPSVGYIVDNVDFSGSGSIGTLLDVSQIEVLKGPQGTRYGANALAGLIYVKTNDPTDKQAASLRLSAGDYNQRTFDAVINQPLTSNLNSRLAIERHTSDGYYRNAYLGRDDTNNQNETTARLKLSLDVGPNWQLLLGTNWIDIDNGYDVFSLDNDRRTLSDQPGVDKQLSKSIFVQSNWQGDFGDAEIIIARANTNSEYSFDEDWTFTGFDPNGYTSFDQYNRYKQMTSFEVRLISNPASRLFADSTDWIVGYYSLKQTENLLRQYTFLSTDFNSDFDFGSNAVFFQLDTDLSESWLLSYGARLESRDADYKNTDGLDVTTQDNLWGGKIALKFIPSSNSLAYLSVAKGYKAGGFNTDGSLPTNLREFDPEALLEWEIGFKSSFASGAVDWSAAIFHDQRRDQQVKSSFVRPRPDGSTEFVDFLGNAAAGTNQGLEVDVRWQLNEHFSLNTNLGLLDAKFDKFINSFNEDLSGRDQAQAPRKSYVVGLHWQAGPWQASLTGIGKDKFYFSDRHNLQSTDTRLTNATLAYQAEDFTIRLWGRNLTNKDYTIRGFGTFGNDPRNGYITEPYVQLGEPRVMGITFEVNFGDPS